MAMNYILLAFALVKMCYGAGSLDGDLAFVYYKNAFGPTPEPEGHIYDASGESPNFGFRPNVNNLAVSHVKDEGKSSGRFHYYKCDVSGYTNTEYDTLAMEHYAVNVQFAVTKCQCRLQDGVTVSNTNHCNGARTQRHSHGDYCIILGRGQIEPDMDCDPFIVDILANTQGHGPDPGHEEQFVQQFNNEQPNSILTPSAEEGGFDSFIHPYRLTCPNGYKMLTCNVNAPRQHERYCPIRTKDLYRNTVSAVSPSNAYTNQVRGGMEHNRPVMYEDPNFQYCQTTRLCDRPRDTGEKAIFNGESYGYSESDFIPDPFGCKTIQLRCILDDVTVAEFGEGDGEAPINCKTTNAPACGNVN